MGKKMKKRSGKFLSLLLAAVLFLEPAAGSVTVYATEQDGNKLSIELTDDLGGNDSDGAGSSQEDGYGGGTQQDGAFEETPDIGENGGSSGGGIEDGGLSGEEEDNDGQEGTSDGDSSENGEESNESGGDDSGAADTDTDDIDEKDSDEDAEEKENTDGELSEEEDSEEASDLEDKDASAKEETDQNNMPVTEEELALWAKESGRIPNGYMDIDYEVERLTAPVAAGDNSFPAADKASAVPAKYDAREAGVLSSIRNQANWGCCWSFSAVAAAESAYIRLKGEEANLSETQLVNFFYSGNAGIDLEGPDGGLSGDKTTALTEAPVQQGGNSFFTTFALSSWTGIADEATDASLVYPSVAETASTDDLSISSEYAYTDAMHLENAYWISLEDMASVKKAIVDYGAVGVSYYYSEYYDSDSYKYFVDRSYEGPAVYYNPDYASTNHAVAIVGWDDNFDRNQFQYTYINAASEDEPVLPERNGAWLIRNSWGTDVLDGGYFWISYEDKSFTGGTAFAFDFAMADNYDHNYQYDGSTGVRSMSKSGELTAAAVYTASGIQTVSAVGAAFASASTDYTVQIYTDLTDENNPESGILAAAVSGRTSFEGFYTIAIDDFVLVDEGEKFGVVVTASKEDGAVGLFVDTSYPNGDWISFEAATANDNTFYKQYNSWYHAGQTRECTFRIKAYTNDLTAPADEESDIELHPDMLEEIVPQEYNGGKATPDIHLMYSGTALIKDIDYTVEYRNNDKVSTTSEKAGVIVRGIGKYTGEITADFTITKKTMQADMLSIEGWVYDGTAHENILTVANQGTPLVENVDYTVKYNKSPLHAGAYTVTVTGKGSNYSGSAKKSFSIEKRALTDEMITLSQQQAVYTGKAIKPAVTVKCGENVIPASNYTINYKNNKAVGTASVTVTGKTDCQGTVTKEFVIEKKTLAEEHITVKAGAVYTGKEIKPGLTVKVDGITLKLNRDYQITGYENHIHATTENSKAEVFIEGIGNYDGSVTKRYEIKPQTAAANKVKATLIYGYGEQPSVCDVTVNGNVIDASDYTLRIVKAGTEESVAEDSLQLGVSYDVTITLQGNYTNANNKAVLLKNLTCKKAVGGLTVSFDAGWETAAYEYKGSAYKPAVVVKDGDTVLKKTKDYSISYSDNVNAGTAAVVITGKGSYSGSLKLPFTIRRKTADNLKVTIPDKTYTGSAITSPVTVKDGGKKLKAGTDYTYAYDNNVNVSYREDGTIDRRAKVTITLLNYMTDSQEEEITGYFQINPAKVSSVKTGKCYYQGEGAAVEPEVTVKAGKLQLADSEYSVVYTGNTKLNNKAKVTVTGRGNYTGSKSVTFKIAKEPLSKAEVTGIADQIYTGTAIECKDLAVKNSSQVLIPADNYTVAYKNNMKAGTASVTIKAKADSIYSGSVTKKFKIAKAELADMVKVELSELASKTYTGGKQTYQKSEIQQAVTASVPGDVPTYKISYENNVNAGMAVLVLTGTGNYTGKVRIDFPIQPRRMDDVEVSLKNDRLPYIGNGTSVFAEIRKVVYGKIVLKRGRDYTVSYINHKNRGAAAVKVTGTGNYTGTRTAEYVIW